MHLSFSIEGTRRIPMRTWMSSGLLSLVSVTALCGYGCRRTASEDSSVSASRQVEEAQQQSKDAYDRAKKAQDKAIDEQREATRAQETVNEKRDELAEAEAKADHEQQESVAAQAEAQRQGEAAQQEAQSAQQRAARLQQQAQTQEPAAGAGSYSTAQARTADGHQMQTRSAQSHDTRGDYSWLTAGAWNSAPTTAAPSEPAPTATNGIDEVTHTVQSAAASTFVDNVLLEPLTNNELTISSSDDTSLHVLNAKVDADTKITKDGKDATFSDIVDGDHAKVTYRMDHNQPIAESIDITSGR
jgi:flagellar biosynthesis GTPase FlhF